MEKCMEKCEERESVILENQGQKIFGILHIPYGPPPFPAVLMCHGLGGHKTGKFRLYVILAQKLSRLGIASLRIDFRGSGDSEGDFSDMTLESEVSDAALAIEYLRNHPEIDDSRLGIFGRSAGGTVALMAAEKVGGIKSLAAWAPLYDGSQWLERWHQLHAPGVADEHRQENMQVNGQVPGRAFFQQLFSLHMEEYLKHLEQIPFLHIHGDLDHIVTTQHADRYMDARHTAKGENKFIRLPNSDHDFSHTKEQLHALDETAKWFSNTL